MKILIVEDEPMIAEDLEMILMKEGYDVVGKVYDAEKALDMIHNRQPDLLLLDISLSSSITGIDIAKIVKDKYRIPFIFITSFSDKDTLNTVKELFPSGYLTKPFKKNDIIALLQMIDYKLSNSSEFRSHYQINELATEPLTSKEYEILLDVANGLSNEDLCQKHFISLNTVKTHLKKIFSKLDVKNRTAALLKARNPGV
jgi:DNA-binding NarL/FixJ family response regulator